MSRGRRWKWAPVTACVIALSGLACHDDPAGIPWGTSPPAIAGVAVQVLDQNTGMVTALLRTNGRSTAFHIEYGKTTAYGSRSKGGIVAPDTGVTGVSDTLYGIAFEEPFHFRVVAISEGGATTGPDSVLSLSGILPRLEESLMQIAVASGPVVIVSVPVWTRNRVTACYLEYGTTPAFGSRTAGSFVLASAGHVEFRDTLAGLSTGSTYMVRAVASSDGGTRRGTSYTVFITDVLQTLMNGDSIAWDFHGGTWSYGASTAYYRGPKTWRLAGTSVEGGERITLVEEIFYGYRYRIDPIPRDTVWLGGVTTELAFREAASGMMRFRSPISAGSWSSWSAMEFPRYWLGIGGTADVTYDGRIGGNGPTMNLKIHQDNGLIFLSARVSGGGTSTVCELVRR